MSRLLKILLIILAACPVWGVAPAQNAEALFSQYYMLPTLYNAGATGNSDYLRIRGGARLQWIGIDNAPKSFTGTADMPIKIGKRRIGVGVALMQEGIGLFSNLDLGVQASYKLKLFKGELGIGVQGAYLNSAFKGSGVMLPDGDDYHESDEAIPTQDLAGNSFDFSAGLWYAHPKFYVGISGRHLLAPTITMSMEESENSESQEYDVQLDRTLYFTAGSNIKLKNTLFELQPSVIVMTDLTSYTGQVDMRARYNRMFSFGFGYRWKSGVNVSLGAEFKNFCLGYSYEYPLSAIAKASSGSHEIVAGYSLKLDFSQKNKNKHRSIRFM